MAEEQTSSQKNEVAAYVEQLFTEWDAARKSRESKLIECYWNTHSEYSPGIQGQWRDREAQDEDASKIFMGQTQDKVRGAYAQVSDALVGLEFDLEPIAVEGLEEEAAQERVKGMENEIEGFLKIGEAGQMLNEVAYSGAWSGVGIFRAPVTAEDITMVAGFEDGAMTNVRKTKDYPKAVQVDPFTFYPDPKGKNEQDGRGYILAHQYDPSELRREGRALGWDMDAIDRVLKKGAPQNDNTESWQSSVDSAKGETSTENKSETYNVREFWGIAKVGDLKEYNIEVDDAELGFEATDSDYIECCLVTCNNEVLKGIQNPWYPASYRPLKVWQWDLLPSNQWGYGTAEAMLPEQKIINGGTRLFMDNTGLIGNPMFEIDPEKLVPGQDLKTFYPGKKWVLKKGEEGAIREIPITALPDGVLTLIQLMQANAENNTGVTFIANQSSSETATAAAIDQSKLTSTNRARLRRLDEMVEQLIEWYVRWVNEAGDPEEYGDVKIPVTVKATGILKTALVRELQTLRLQQLIGMIQAGIQMPKIGPQGSALEGYDISRVYKHAFRALGVDDVELSDKEREEIILESLGEAGAQLREMLDSGAGIEEVTALLGTITGGGPGGAGGSVPTAGGAGIDGNIQPDAGTAGQLTGGINEGIAGGLGPVTG